MGGVGGDDAVDRREQHAAGVVAGLDGLLDRVVGDVLALQLGQVERDVRQHLERRVEEHQPLDPLRFAGRELGRQPAAEAVADPDRGAVRHRLEDRGQVGVHVPRRLPARVAVAEQVERDHVPAGVGEEVEPPAVRGDAVQADDRRSAGSPHS